MAKGNREEAITLLSDTSLKLKQISERTGVPMGSLGALSNKYRKEGFVAVAEKPVANKRIKGDVDLATKLIKETDKPISHIIKETGVSHKMARQLGFEHRDKPFRRGPQFGKRGAAAIMTDEWINEHLIEKGMTLQEMATILNVTRERVRQLLDKMGYHASQRKDAKEKHYWRNAELETTELNREYFDTIDTEEKAYWLGYLTARARTVVANDYGRKTVDISIAPKNKDHMELFKEAIELKSDFQSIYNKTADKEYYRLTIQSHYLASRLEELHIESPKHHLTRLPEELSKDLIPHYFRGHFDGKGFIWKHPEQDHRQMLFMYGSDPLLYDFCVYLTEEVGLKLTDSTVGALNDSHLHFIFRVHAMYKIENIINALYNDATIYQDRNLEKYLSLLD